MSGIIRTCTIDTFERRDVATVVIAGAFLQTKISKGEKHVHVILDGIMSEVLEKLAPETYQTHVHGRHK